MNPRMLMRSTRYRARLALGVVTFCAVAGLVGATGAFTLVAGATTSSDSGNSGNSGNSGSGSSAAGVSPLLKMFEFGNTVGLPLACADTGSIVSIFGAQSGNSELTTPLVLQLNKECNQLSSEGNGYLQQAMAESQGLTLVNPAVDPLIADLANGFTTVGTQYGSSLGPFGPTVSGLSGTVAFFEGT